MRIDQYAAVSAPALGSLLLIEQLPTDAINRTYNGITLTDLKTVIGLSGPATSSGLTTPTATILGRTTAGAGAVEALTVGTSLSLAAGVLNTIQGIRTTDAPTFATLTASASFALGYNTIFFSNTAATGYVQLQLTANLASVAKTAGLQWVPGSFLKLFSPDTTPVILQTGAGGTQMILDGSGNVGIGGAPAVKFDVVGAIRAHNQSNSGFTQIEATCGATDTIQNVLAASNGSGGVGIVGTITNHSILFYINGLEKMRLDTSGNLGIGYPAVGGAGTYHYLEISGSSGGALVFREGSTSRGIIYSSSGGGMVFDTSPGNLVLQTGGANRLQIDGSGNIVVGVASPVSSQRFRLIGVDATSVNYGLFVGDNAGQGNFMVRNDGFCSFPKFNSFTSASAANVFMDGSGGIFKSTSSMRYKKNIVTYARGLNDLLKLRPVSYQGINEVDTGKTFAGLTAEEVDAAGLTEYVTYDKNNRPDALHYSQMVALLINSIKEISARLLTLEAA